MQLPTALADRGLEMTDPGTTNVPIEHAIATVCRQEPSSTTIKVGGNMVLNCLGVIEGVGGVPGIQVMS